MLTKKPFTVRDLTDDFDKTNFDSYMTLKAKRDNAMKKRDELKTRLKQDAVNDPGWKELDDVTEEMNKNPFSKNLEKYNEFYNQFYNQKKPKPSKP